MLSVFCDSRLDYYHQFVTGLMPRKAPSKPMVLGTIVHAMLLERKLVTDVAILYPNECYKKDGFSINPVPARAFEDANPGKLAVKEEVMDQAELICESAMKSILGPVLSLDVEFEQRADAVVCGMPCRCKPDIHSPKLGLVYDLKVGQVKPNDFHRSAKRFKYWLQAAFYVDILSTLHNRPFTFRFFAIEPTFPFRVQMYEYDESSMETAHKFSQDKLRELKACQETGDWSDQWSPTVVLGPWDLGENEESDKVDWSEE